MPAGFNPLPERLTPVVTCSDTSHGIGVRGWALSGERRPVSGKEPNAGIVGLHKRYCSNTL